MKKKAIKDNRIGIMSVQHQGKKPFGMQTYFFEDMVKYSHVDQNRLFFFSPIDWSETKVHGFKFIDGEWVEVIERIPEIIYDRSFSQDEEQKKKIEAVRQILHSSGKIILNPLDLANLLNDKIGFHTFLLENNIPTLSTFPFNTINEKDVFELIGSSKIYIKPIFGSKGEGIFVIEKRDEEYILFDNIGKFESFKNYRLLLDKLSNVIDDQERYFLQEAAEIVNFNEAPFDIRVLVQNFGDKYIATGKAVRIGRKKSMTSNLNSGGMAMPIEELQHFFLEHYMYSLEKLHLDIEQMCLECVDVLRKSIGEFCEIGFDILIIKDKGPIIIEGNAKPSRWVFVKMADYLEDQGKDNTYYLGRRKETVSVPIKYGNYIFENQNRKTL